jgi:O-antigen ligase
MLHWGVYFIVISVIFRTLGTIYIGPLTLNQFIIIGLFLIAFFVKLIQKHDIKKPRALSIALILFGAYMFFSNFVINSDHSIGVRYCDNFARSLLCYFLVVTLIDTRKKINLFMLSYIIASIAMVLTADVQSQVTSGLHLDPSGGRTGIEGLSEHYIKYAQYSLISLPLVYAFFKNTKKRSTMIVCIVAMMLLAVGALFSGSRGAVLTFLVIFFAIVIQELKQRKQFGGSRGAIIFTLIAILLFSVFWVSGGDKLFESVFSVFSGKPSDASLSGRLWIAKLSLKHFMDNPFFGLGLNQVYNLHLRVPHNQWLQILSELGLIGILLSIVIVYHLFKTLSVSKQNAVYSNDRSMINIINSVTITIFSMLIWGFYENLGFIQAEKILFMIFGFAEALRSYTNNEKIEFK